MRDLILDFAEFEDKKEVLCFLAEELEFPSYFGVNLDALYDVLSTYDTDVNLHVFTAEKAFETAVIGVLSDVCEENPHIAMTIMHLPE